MCYYIVGLNLTNLMFGRNYYEETCCADLLSNQLQRNNMHEIKNEL